MAPNSMSPIQTGTKLTDEQAAQLTAISVDFGEMIGQILTPAKKFDRFQSLAALNELELTYRNHGIPNEFLLMLRGIIKAIEAAK